MLFSATLDGVVGNMARRITKDPMVIQIASAANRHENITQRVHFVDDLSHKNRLLDHLLRDDSLDQAVVFTATKRDADTIADRLNIAGFAAAALHGDMHQGARNRTLDSMRRGQVKVLVATDVAARGIDVPTITHVVNYDLPKFPEDYVHRIGRTGRAGRNGLAISLVNHAEGMNVKRIERFTKQLIPVPWSKASSRRKPFGGTLDLASRRLETRRQPHRRQAIGPAQRSASQAAALRAKKAAPAAATKAATHAAPTAPVAATAIVNRQLA
jgi:superfamily II DNA/RNA helicase